MKVTGRVCLLRADLSPVFLLRAGILSRQHERQTVENATYEGTRRGIVPGATAPDCRNAAQLVLNTIGTNDAVIGVNPAVITSNTSQVTVSIAVALNSNSWVSPLFFKNKTLSTSMTMRRERFSNGNVP